MISSILLRGRTGSASVRFTSSALSHSKTQRRLYSESATQKPPSGHAQWYSDTLPAMVPIFLLGSAVYLALQLTQHKLSHEKFVEEASTRIRALEAEVNTLQEKRASESVTTNSKETPVHSMKSWWWW